MTIKVVATQTDGDTNTYPCESYVLKEGVLVLRQAPYGSLLLPISNYKKIIIDEA